MLSYSQMLQSHILLDPTSKALLISIGVPAQKIFGGNEVLPKSCDVCPNHDFLVLYG